MKQANLGLNADELIARQAWLQNQVRAVDAATGLLAVASSAGHAEIVGSYRMGLMVWPDIDITIATPGQPDLQAALSILERLMSGAGVRKANIVDRRMRNDGDLPPGIYLGPDVDHDGIAWQVDIWLVDEATVRKREILTQRFMARLTEERRRAILAIKQVAAASDVYHRGVSSVDIYTAVLDHGLTTPAEFADWLAESGRSL